MDVAHRDERRQVTDFRQRKTMVLPQGHTFGVIGQVEDRFTPRPDHMDVTRTVIIRINHKPQALEAINRWHPIKTQAIGLSHIRCRQFGASPPKPHSP